MKIKRVIWVILDSAGAGELPDADKFGDKGSNTLGNLKKKFPDLRLPNLERLGLSGIEEVGFESSETIIGSYGRAAELSQGKDTTAGHWEMVGIVSEKPFPTYPEGFPKEITDAFINVCSIPGILGNCTASGTAIIKKLGAAHMETKKPIVYTSADSVFQIACHEEVYPIEKLYDMCRKARELLTGEHAVARVIARPFIGSKGVFERTANRRDFSLEPPKDNLLVKLNSKGLPVIGVGKIEDIFAGSGITKAIHTKDNMDGIDVTLAEMDTCEHGLIFTNLVEFDSKWGHRNDAKGYAQGLINFDNRLPEILSRMTDEDMLIINADHGCDPTTAGTDHSREYIPVVVYGKWIQESVDLGTLSTFADIGATIGEIFDTPKLIVGESFLNKIVGGK